LLYEIDVKSGDLNTVKLFRKDSGSTNTVVLLADATPKSTIISDLMQHPVTTAAKSFRAHATSQMELFFRMQQQKLNYFCCIC